MDDPDGSLEPSMMGLSRWAKKQLATDGHCTADFAHHIRSPRFRSKIRFCVRFPKFLKIQFKADEAYPEKISLRNFEPRTSRFVTVLKSLEENICLKGAKC